MPIYNIEWQGTITRDIGWADIEAPDAETAEQKYMSEHPMRRVRSVILDDSKPLPATPATPTE